MKTLKILIVMTLFLIQFYSCLTVLKAQTLDDVIPKFSLTELKLINGYLLELQFKREQNNLLLEENSFLDSLLLYKDKEISLLNEKFSLSQEKNKMLISYIEQNSQKFYDNFTFGFITSSILSITLFIILR